MDLHTIGKMVDWLFGFDVVRVPFNDLESEWAFTPNNHDDLSETLASRKDWNCPDCGDDSFEIRVVISGFEVLTWCSSCGENGPDVKAEMVFK